MYILPLPLFLLPLFLSNIYAMATGTDAPTHSNPDAHHDDYTNNIQIHHQFHQNDHRDVTGVNENEDEGNSVCFGERAEKAEMLRCEEPYVRFFVFYFFSFLFFFLLFLYVFGLCGCIFISHELWSSFNDDDYASL